MELIDYIINKEQQEELKSRLSQALVGKAYERRELNKMITKIIREFTDSILPRYPPVTVRRDPNEPNRVICEFALRPLLLKDEEHESTH